MKVYQGKIVSLKMAKTIVVEVERFLSHKLYKKRYKRSKNYLVHSDLEHKLGEFVKFVETKPVSKLKKWKVVNK